MTRVRTLGELFVARLLTYGALTLTAVVLRNWDTWTF